MGCSIWAHRITSVSHVLKVNEYGERQAKGNEKNLCFKGWETLVYNELGLKSKNKKTYSCVYMLDKNEDGTFEITPKFGDSNKSFSYHLFLKQTIEEAIKSNNIQKYHFTLLRNLYEKTASFLGYPQWSDLLPDDKQTYYNRIIQFTSHSTLSNEAVAEPTTAEKQTVNYLFEHLVTNRYWEEEQK